MRDDRAWCARATRLLRTVSLACSRGEAADGVAATEARREPAIDARSDTTLDPLESREWGRVVRRDERPEGVLEANSWLILFCSRISSWRRSIIWRSVSLWMS